MKDCQTAHHLQPELLPTVRPPYPKTSEKHKPTPAETRSCLRTMILLMGADVSKANSSSTLAWMWERCVTVGPVVTRGAIDGQHAVHL